MDFSAVIQVVILSLLLPQVCAFKARSNALNASLTTLQTTTTVVVVPNASTTSTESGSYMNVTATTASQSLTCSLTSPEPSYWFSDLYNLAYYNSDRCRYEYCASELAKSYPNSELFDSLSRTVSGESVGSSIFSVTASNAGNRSIVSVSTEWYTTITTQVNTGFDAYLGGGGKEPCCDFCRVGVGPSIDLHYWPPNDPLLTNTKTTKVVNGVTVTSPSVYFSFDTLSGINACSTMGTVTSRIATFDPVIMRSLLYITSESHWTTYTVDWDALYYRNCSNKSYGSQTTYDPHNLDPSNVDACHPRIGMPDGFLSQIDPTWNTCTIEYWGFGFFDPPMALTPELELQVDAKTTVPAAQGPGPITHAVPPASATPATGPAEPWKAPPPASAPATKSGPRHGEPRQTASPASIPPTQPDTGHVEPWQADPLTSPRKTVDGHFEIEADPPASAPQPNGGNEALFPVPTATASPVDEQNAVQLNGGPKNTAANDVDGLLTTTQSLQDVPDVLRLGSFTYSAKDSLITLGPLALTNGAPAATVEGHTVSFGGGHLIIDDTTQQLNLKTAAEYVVSYMGGDITIEEIAQQTSVPGVGPVIWRLLGGDSPGVSQALGTSQTMGGEGVDGGPRVSNSGNSSNGTEVSGSEIITFTDGVGSNRRIEGVFIWWVLLVSFLLWME